VRVLLDTNIIVDDALEREPFWEESEEVLLLAEQGQIEGFISASTFGDLYYIIRKPRGRNWTLTYLRQLATFCQVATVDQAVINIVLTSNFKDFEDGEDGIQYGVAMLHNLDAIITRNSEDFPVATPRILTPQQLIQELNESN
jgi:predicted nucleic acid-binding protein